VRKQNEKKGEIHKMEKISYALEQMKQINFAYEISNDSIDEIEKEMEDAKVCTPVIGKFSSGKSALINTILGYEREILKVDITPETAVPAEIVLSEAEESVTIVYENGTCENMSVSDYRNYVVDAGKVQCVRINLDNTFLKKIPSVMIVDMPGFESGFEVHDKAIDNYVSKSLAYIVAFPADDMIIRNSVGNILKELCLHDMPICVVITKSDKCNEDFEETFDNLKQNLRRFIDGGEICYCKTSSRLGNVEELQEFLEKIQEDSRQILYRKFRIPTLAVLDTTEQYLKARLTNSQLSASELDEQEEKLANQMEGLNSKLSKEQKCFMEEISNCLEDIKGDIQRALESEESTLVAMALNRQDINEQLKNIIRSAVTASIKKRLVPTVEKYLKRVEHYVTGESIGDIQISFHYDAEEMNKGLTAAIVLIAGRIFGPLGMIIAGVMVKLQGDKKREEAKQKIQTKLRNEVFPEVLSKVSCDIETAIREQVGKVNETIEKEIQNQRDTLEKAMADVKEKMNDAQSEKEKLAADIEADLERIGEIRNGL